MVISRPLLIILYAITGLALAGCAAMATGDPDPMTATGAPRGEYPRVHPKKSTTPGLESLSWTLAGTSEDGKTLYLAIGVGGACSSDESQLSVEETDAYVRITSAAGTTGDSDCAALLKTRDVSVELTRPLGKRPLLHAPLGLTSE